MNQPRRPWITLIVLHFIQALTLLPWLMVAGLSVMAFDSPGSDQMWQPWAFVLAIWSYPLWLLLAAVASWVLLLGFRRRIAALALAAVLTLPFPVLFGFFALAAAE